MQHTTYTVGFTDPNTIQLRLELGTVVDAAQNTTVPDGISPDAQGFVYDNGWIERQTGAKGRVFSAL